jgi:hypothetical protein
MKRFLRKVGLLTVAMTMMLSSGIAYGGDADSTHGWMRTAPTDIFDDFPRTTSSSSRLKRHQTLYWALSNISGTVYVIDTVANDKRACTVGGTPNCVSAPLHIVTNDALLCLDSDISDATTDGDSQVRIHICSDETCDETGAGRVNGIETPDPAGAGWCTTLGETPAASGGNSAPGPFRAGGLWVYIEATVLPAGVGETSLFWIVGQ